jgi:hypothetical protein
MITSIENDLTIKILKLEVSDDGCYGHFIMDEIFLKAKSKSRTGPPELKFMIPQELK